MDSISWLPNLQRRHTHMMTAAMLLCTILSVVGCKFPMPLQIALFFGGFALGIPHGAADHLIGYEICYPKFGRYWTLVFYSGYIALALAVLVIWQLAPISMLFLFLFVFITHIIQCDKRDKLLLPRFIYWVEIVVRVGILVVLGWFSFPQDVERLYMYILPLETISLTELHALLLSIYPYLIVLTTIALTVLTLFYFILAAHQHSISHLLAGVEVVALALLFLTTPPLIGITLYFVSVHCLQSFFRWIAKLELHSTKFNLFVVVMRFLPLTLVPIILTYIFWMTVDDTYGFIGRIIHLIIVGISALTFPHMIVTAVSENKKILPNSATW